MSAHSLIHVASTLSLDAATRIVDAALNAARSAGLLPLAVAVLDAGGHLVALKREDGCGTLRVDIAMGKASAALGMGMATRSIRDRLAQRMAFQAALAAAADGRFIPVPGGVLICNGEGQRLVRWGLAVMLQIKMSSPRLKRFVPRDFCPSPMNLHRTGIKPASSVNRALRFPFDRVAGTTTPSRTETTVCRNTTA